jgi:uridine phosphorylase
MIHLRPTAELAERVLLPGDPGRALALAQELLVRPQMFNHHRGLWGYTGAARRDGNALTIQSTGMGGPSAAIVVHELIELGARRMIRVGTCAALAPDLELGDLVVAVEAISADGTSRALGGHGPALAADGRVLPDKELLRALLAGAEGHAGPVLSTDLFYDPPGAAREASDKPSGSALEASWRRSGAIAVELEAATVLTLASLAGVAAACVLVIAAKFGPAGLVRIEESQLAKSVSRMGELAVAAVGC